MNIDSTGNKKVLGTFESKSDPSEGISVVDMQEIEIDGTFNVYITIFYKGEEHNVFLQTKNFEDGNCPYNTNKIEKVPYFIVENEVYYLADAFDISNLDDEDLEDLDGSEDAE